MIFYHDDIFTRSPVSGAFIPCFKDQIPELLLLTLPQRVFSRVTAFPARLHELRDILYPRLPSGLPMGDQTAGTGLHGMVFRTLCMSLSEIKNFHTVFNINNSTSALVSIIFLLTARYFVKNSVCTSPVPFPGNHMIAEPSGSGRKLPEYTNP